MIKNEIHYRSRVRDLQHYIESTERYRQAMILAGYTPEQVERGMEPILSYQARLEEELLEWEASNG